MAQEIDRLIAGQQHAMDLPIRQLRYFVAVAREKSFTKPAELLRVSQPAVSVGLQNLEFLLGFHLLDRASKRLELTKEGEAFLPHAQKILDAYGIADAVVERIRSGHTGTLRIGTPAYTIDVPERHELLAGFMQHFPDIDMEIITASMRESLPWLRAGDLDTCFAIGTIPPDFDSLLLKEVDVDLLIPVEHQLAKLDIIDQKAIDGLKIYSIDRRISPPLYDCILAPLVALNARLIAAPSSNFISIVRFARMNRKIVTVFEGFVPDHELVTGDMVRRKLSGSPASFSFSLVKKVDDANVPTQLFWSFAQKPVGSTLPVANYNAWVRCD